MTGTRNPYQKKVGASRLRVTLAVSLCLLLPPIGLLFMWRAEVFRVRGRLFMTFISALEMAILLSLGLFGIVPRSNMPPTVLPMPEAAVAVTSSPDEETINALTNIDELLAAGVRDIDETIAPDATSQLTQEQEMALQEEIYNTTVYSVYSGAVYYHLSTVCGTQSNRRSLTIREAVQEGMGACPNCDPPVP